MVVWVEKFDCLCKLDCYDDGVKLILQELRILTFNHERREPEFYENLEFYKYASKIVTQLGDTKKWLGSFGAWVNYLH